MTLSTNGIDPEAAQKLLREYYGLIFKRFDAFLASVLLGYVSLCLLGLTVSTDGTQMWLALIATILTTLGSLQSQVVWANAN